MNKRVTGYGLRVTDPQGFTLIELLVVIAIIAILVAFVVVNFVGARQRANDVKKKTELQQMKNALRLYYNDYNSYPAPDTASTNAINGCGTAVGSVPPSVNCNTQCLGQFASGGVGGCDTVYMKLLPLATEYEWKYQARPAFDDFCLWATLDNVSDSEIVKSQNKCRVACASIPSSTDYVVCAD